MKRNTRILGIDPGTRYTGVGVIDRSGNRLKRVHSERIITVRCKTLDDKLLNIFERITEIIDLYQPDVLSIEKIFHSVNPHSSLILGHARGVSILAGKLKNLDIREYAPNEIKRAVVGVGRAGKAQVSAMVQILLNLDRTVVMKEDESDALAIAICHANTQDFSAMNMNQLIMEGK